MTLTEQLTEEKRWWVEGRGQTVISLSLLERSFVMMRDVRTDRGDASFWVDAGILLRHGTNEEIAELFDTAISIIPDYNFEK